MSSSRWMTDSKADKCSNSSVTQSAAVTERRVYTVRIQVYVIWEPHKQGTIITSTCVYICLRRSSAFCCWWCILHERRCCIIPYVGTRPHTQRPLEGATGERCYDKDKIKNVLHSVHYYFWGQQSVRRDTMDLRDAAGITPLMASPVWARTFPFCLEIITWPSGVSLPFPVLKSVTAGSRIDTCLKPNQGYPGPSSFDQSEANNTLHQLFSWLRTFLIQIAVS